MAKKSDEPPPSQLAKTLKLVVAILKAGFSPSLMSYFFWTATISLLFSGYSFINLFVVKPILCAVPAQFNVSQNHLIGCENCTDTLLMCSKGPCWRYAVNITLQRYAEGVNDKLYKAFQQAALDVDCNNIIATLTDTDDTEMGPDSMLAAIIDMRAKSAGATPTDSCIAFHCQVLMEAVVRAQNSDLASPPSTCTNVYGTKQPWEATACVCDSVHMGISEAQKIATLCGPTMNVLPSIAFDRMISSRDKCYQTSVAQAKPIPSLSAAWTKFTSDANCTFLVTDSSSPFNWFVVRAQQDDLFASNKAQGINQDSWQIPQACDTIMCYAFNATLNNPQCNYTSNANLQSDITSTTIAKMVTTLNKYCSLSKWTFTSSGICSSPTLKQTAFCPSSTGRLLESSELIALDLGPAAAAKSTAGAAEEPGAASAPLCNTSEEAHTSPRLPVDTTWNTSPIVLSAEERELQGSGGSGAPTTTAAATSGTEAYTTTPWSKCTCYQQCVAGVATRTVSCPAGSCKQPPPAASQSCTCSHCANCIIEYNLWALGGGYGFAGLCAAILWLVFWSVSNMDEDDMADMRCGTKCLGCICKFLPPIIHSFTYIGFLLIVAFVVQAIVPISFGSDCKTIGALASMCWVIIGCWVIQTGIGCWMAKFKPMPAWLYQPTPQGSMKYICAPLKAVGPI